ncbi:PTS system mannose/fructose/N-acetylgalactosamine-transporter subunit IIB [Lacticaseibacillus chiayiensis]|uniref:PTS system mannose/fructose/N-acetylgalactosamine-transporter subunit IIB n=1 Tax=Lacticaseibacillus chiayiensis TaxID=2100821 RepID=UPI003C712854
MIKMLRIDDRLIHGQVAVVWSKNLGVSRIIVISDSVSKNEVQKSALKMAAPENIKTFIQPVDEALKLLNDPRAAKLSIMVVMNDPKEVKRVLEGLIPEAKPKTLNLANYGRIVGDLEDKRKITDTVYLTDDEVKIFKDLSAENFKFIYQPLPSDTAKPLDELI